MRKVILREQGAMKAIGTHTRNGKPVVCITNGMRFASATDAAEWLGCHVSSISYCCTGKYASVKGFVFKYVKENPEECVDMLSDRVLSYEDVELFEKYRDVIAELEEEEKRKKADQRRYEKWVADMEKATEVLENAKVRLNKAQVAFEVAAEKYADAEQKLVALMEMA